MTILEIIHQLRDKVKKHLPIILIISIAVAALAGIYIAQKPISFIASSKIFPLSANSARGSSSPISQLQEQFGLKGEGSNEIYDIEELINSKKLSFSVVAAKPVNKKYQTLYEWLVADYNSELGWRGTPIKLSTDPKDSLSNLITGRGLLLDRVKVEVGENDYTTIQVTAYEKELAKELNENILITLSDFYIDFVTEKPRSDLLRIQAMRDSLNIELSAVERAKAGVLDQSAYATKAYVGLPMIKLQRREAEIQALYETTVNALQNARFKLLAESPIFQILDYPGEPYGVKMKSWQPIAVIAFILTFFLLCLWFTRKIFLNLIIEELKKA